MIPSAAYAADIDTTEFDEHLPEIEPEVVQHFAQIADGDIVIRPVTEADLPAKFHELMRTNAKFRDSWNMNRPDFENQSRSTFEQSLATLAAHRGFIAQEICDILVSFRHKWQGARRGKAHYRCTISKALGSAKQHERERQETQAEAASIASREQVIAEKDPKIRKEKLLALVNSHPVIFPRLQFVDVVASGPYFIADIACRDQRHEIQIGTARELNGVAVPQANILAATGVNVTFPARKKGTLWTPLIELLVAIAHSQPAKFQYGIEEETKGYLLHALRTLAVYSHTALLLMDPQDDKEMYWVNRCVHGTTRDKFLRYSDAAYQAFIWPHFVFWGIDQRLYVHVDLFRLFLECPIGGNRKIAMENLMHGMTCLRFEFARVITGVAGNGETNTAKWAVSPPGFEVDCEVAPRPPQAPRMPAGSNGSNGHNSNGGMPLVPFEVGDLVEWWRDGSPQPCFRSGPHPIRNFSKDRKIAFFDVTVSQAGIPVDELIKTNIRSIR